MRIKLFPLAALAALLLSVLAPSLAIAQTPQPMMAYISSIKGQKSGQIKGDSVQRGREGWMQLYDYKHEIVSPRDAASGLATGRRMHKPVTITRKVGAGSPLLMNVLCTNENLTEVKFSFWQPNPRIGTEVNYYSIALTNASISSYRQFHEPGVGLMEEISFTYQKIEMILTDGGVSSMDEWMVRN